MKVKRRGDSIPFSLIIATDHAAIFYYSRQYEQTVEKFRQVQEMDPDFPRAHFVINAYLESGRYTDAIAEADKLRHTIGEVPGTWIARSLIYCISGKKRESPG